MKLVVDTNVLFSYFNSKSKIIELLKNQNLQLFAPKYAVIELEKYKSLIKNKYSLSEDNFYKKIKELEEIVSFLEEEVYIKEKENISEITIDEKDKDFLALSLKLDCALWSNDKALKLQDKVIVLNTLELADLLV